MNKIRIMVADDHEVVRHGLRFSLGVEQDMTVVGEARTGTEAIRMAGEKRPDVMLLDVKLEDMDGPDVCRKVLPVSPKTAVVMLTNYGHDGMVLRSLTAGAKGYVLKDIELAELKKIIRSVHRGHSVLDPKVTTPVITTAASRGARADGQHGQAIPRASLSETDLAIIRHVSNGLTNREIAAMVHLSPHTIKGYIEKIRGVLEVRSRAQIVAEAMKRGLI